MSSVCLLVLCGVPGAGKTTWAQKFINFIHMLNDNSIDSTSPKCQLGNGKEINDSGDEKLTQRINDRYQVIHISYDSLIDEEMETELIEYSKKDIKDTNNSVWKLCRRAIALFVRQLIGDLSLSEVQSVDFAIGVDVVLADLIEQQDSGYLRLLIERLRVSFVEIVSRQMRRRSDFTRSIVIVDDNMYYSSMRYQYFQIAREHEIGFAEVCFPVDLPTALHRNQTRDRRVADAVIVDMFEKFETPSAENSWEKYATIWNHENPDSDSLFRIVKLIDRAFRDPAKQVVEDTEGVEASRVVCSTNLRHQADVVLRKILGQHLTEAKNFVERKSERAQFAASCNSIRLQILEELKNHTLLVPTIEKTQPSLASADAENQFFAFLKDIFSQKLTAIV